MMLPAACVMSPCRLWRLTSPPQLYFVMSSNGTGRPATSRCAPGPKIKALSALALSLPVGRAMRPLMFKVPASSASSAPSPRASGAAAPATAGGALTLIAAPALIRLMEPDSPVRRGASIFRVPPL
ncbi:hypothetical protein D3C71_1481580 [compost metagenome]